MKYQGWYASMLLVSLGVHALLLVLPIPQKSWQPPQSLQPERSPVKITSLVAPQQSSTAVRPVSPPRPVPKPTQLKEQPDRKRVAQPKTTEPVQLPTQAIALPRPTPKATPTATPNPNQPPVSTEVVPTPQPTLTAPDAATELFGDLGSDDRPSESSDPSVAPDLFTNPDLFFDLASLPTQPQLKSEILRATWVAAKTPTQVYIEILVRQGQSQNFQVSERGIYSQGTVYEVKQGENTWYFNLVPTRQAGTAIVVWKRDPSPPI